MAVSKTISATGSHGYHTFTMTVSETAVNTSANTSTCTVKFTIKPKVTGYDWEDYSTSSSNCPHGTVYFNGNSWNWALGAYDGKSTVTLVNKTVTVAHDSDGSKTITGTSSNSQFRFSCSSGSDYYLPGSASAYGSITLTKIDQTPTVTQKVSSKTETSITMQWTSDIAISKVEYRIGTSGSYTSKTVSGTKSGTYTLSGLDPYTAYTIQTRLTSKASGLTASASGSYTTYNWPIVTSCPTFSAYKDGLELQWTNPLNRSCSIAIKYGNTTIYTDTDVIGSITFGIGYFEDILLPLIPNSYSGTYTVETTYNGHTRSRSGTFTSEGANPSITTTSYVDVNATAQAIIRDSSVIVQNISMPRFTVAGTGLYGAKFASGTVQILSTTNNLTVSSENVIVGTAGTVNSASDVVAVVTAVDTRGNSVSQNVTVEMLEYTAPTAIITLNRQSNFYSQTDLKVDAQVLAIGDNEPTITAKWKEAGASSWEGTQTIPDNVTTALNGATGLDNTKEWEVEVTVVDSLGGSSVFGGLSVGIGLPILFIDRKLRSVGVNSFPTASEQLIVNDVDILDALFYKVGDSITFGSGIQFAGLVTSSTKEARFTIHLGKSLKNINTITATQCEGGVRTPTGGYMNGVGDNGDWASQANVSISVTKKSNYDVVLAFSSTVAFTNVSNNQCLVFNASPLKLEFS